MFFPKELHQAITALLHPNHSSNILPKLIPIQHHHRMPVEQRECNQVWKDEIEYCVFGVLLLENGPTSVMGCITCMFFAQCLVLSLIGSAPGHQLLVK